MYSLLNQTEINGCSSEEIDPTANHHLKHWEGEYAWCDTNQLYERKIT